MQRVNLLPKELQRRRFLIDRARLWGIISGSAVLWSLAASWTLGSRVERLQELIGAEEQMSVALSEGRSSVESIRVRQGRIRARHDVLLQVVARADWGEVIGQVAGAGGEEVWIRECRIERTHRPGGLRNGRAEGSEDEPTRLEVSGYALSNAELSRFLSRLGRCRRVTSVEPNNVNQEPVGRGHLVAFNVTCVVGSREVDQDASVMMERGSDETVAGRPDVFTMNVVRTVRQP